MIHQFWGWLRQRFPHYAPLLQDPIMRYMLLPMRVGRTAHGLKRYIRRIQLILLLLLFSAHLIGFVLIGNDLETLFVLLGFGTSMVSIGFFIIADIVTLFFTVTTLRHPLKDRASYDLLHISLLDPMRLTSIRFKLAELRAWRIISVLWWMRFFGWVYSICILGYFILVSVWDGSLYADDSFAYLLVFLLTYGVVYSAMLLLEPFWRVKMLVALAGSLAVRFRNGLLAWLMVVLAHLICIFLQGLFAAGITALSIGCYNLMNTLLQAGYSTALSELNTYSLSFVEIPALLFASIPPFLMIGLVWNLQNWLTTWRTHVTKQYIFRIET